MSKRGRPPKEGLPKDPVLRRKALSKASKERQDVRNMTMNGELLEAFIAAKEQYSKEMPYLLTNKQFFSVILDHWRKQYDRT